MLASGVDGIVIAAPTSFHAELIELCLAAGLPTFCEKPAACDSDEAFFMDRLAGAFRAELAAFTEVVAGRRASPCTVLDAIETGWVAEACTLSLNEHRPVRIEEVRRVR